MTQQKKRVKSCKTKPLPDIPLMYLFIFRQMTKKYGFKDRILPYKAVLEIWKRNVYNVPNKYYLHFIKEMCDMGLLEQISFGRRIIQFRMFGYSQKKCLDKLYEFFLW